MSLRIENKTDEVKSVCSLAWHSKFGQSTGWLGNQWVMVSKTHTTHPNTGLRTTRNPPTTLSTQEHKETHKEKQVWRRNEHTVGGIACCSVEILGASKSTNGISRLRSIGFILQTRLPARVPLLCIPHMKESFVAWLWNHRKYTASSDPSHISVDRSPTSWLIISLSQCGCWDVISLYTACAHAQELNHWEPEGGYIIRTVRSRSIPITEPHRYYLLLSHVYIDGMN